MEWAHSANRSGRRHPLTEHLLSVAKLASGFADTFEAAEPAHYLGLWHDIGKFNPAFQEYLLACEANPTGHNRGPDHKAAGCWLATSNGLGLAAMLIQGHHGGLKTPTGLESWLQQRQSDADVEDALQRARRALPDLEPAGQLPLPDRILSDELAAELYLRLLFSALVDADFLDTERHFQGERAELRGADLSMAELWERFERHHRSLRDRSSAAVSQARRQIYDACLAAAEEKTGLFRLTVPTGGGKTLSGMAFALRHALRHGLQRIIVAVPYISITEQTAGVYRQVFGTDSRGRPAVLEHHSSVVGRESQDEDFHTNQVWSRLASENWDAPIVVTTTVQLFESFFAASTSRNRKLHRLSGSVLILDEAQALPAHFLAPILDVLRGLCAHYDSSVVFSTATQPAFDAIPAFARLPAREIVPEPARFFAALKRVTYEWLTDRPRGWTEMADLMRSHPQALAVLNTKANARSLLEALGDSDALHLSTLLCGAHRRRVIAEVRRRLSAGQPCRLVSTQVIEAGVDLDFPLVLRALGPLDGIIQAAGRCNREGKLESGRVIVFRPEQGGLPGGTYRAGAGITGAFIGRGDLDLDDPSISRSYFQQLFQTVNTDREGIQGLRTRFDYPKVAELFQMIPVNESIAVTNYGSTQERALVARLLNELRTGTPYARSVYRRLQPYLVSVAVQEAARYRRQGLIVPVTSGLGEWLGGYDEVAGLSAEGMDPDALVV